MEQKKLDNQPWTEGEEREIDLAELFGAFLEKWYLILIGLLAGVAVAGLITWFLITPKFTATSKLYMVSNSSDTIVDLSDFNIGNSLSSDYEKLLTVRPILEEIIEEEDLSYTYEQLRDMIHTTTINNTRILEVSVVSASPKEAMTIANALADKAVEEIPILMDTATPNIAERAVIPDQKSSPSMAKNIIIGGLIGALAVMAYLVFLHISDDTMTTADDVQKKLGIMPLTAIPEGDISSHYDRDDDRTSRHQRRHRKGKRL